MNYLLFRTVSTKLSMKRNRLNVFHSKGRPKSTHKVTCLGWGPLTPDIFCLYTSTHHFYLSLLHTCTHKICFYLYAWTYQTCFVSTPHTCCLYISDVFCFLFFFSLSLHLYTSRVYPLHQCTPQKCFYIFTSETRLCPYAVTTTRVLCIVSTHQMFVLTSLHPRHAFRLYASTAQTRFLVRSYLKSHGAVTSYSCADVMHGWFCAFYHPECFETHHLPL